MSSVQDEMKFKPPNDFKGPGGLNRKYTDILFAAIILGVWGLMTAFSVYGLQNGDYRKILFPIMDYDGNICGTSMGDIDMTDYPKILFGVSFTS